MIDDVQGLSERSRKVIFGHSTKTNVSDGYGPKVITEQQAKIVQQLTNRTIWRLAKMLLRAKRRAERDELQVVEAWKIDRRSMDERLQTLVLRPVLGAGPFIHGSPRCKMPCAQTRVVTEPLDPARKPIERRDGADDDSGVVPLKNLLSKIVELGVGGVDVRVHIP